MSNDEREILVRLEQKVDDLKDQVSGLRDQAREDAVALCRTAMCRPWQLLTGDDVPENGIVTKVDRLENRASILEDGVRAIAKSKEEEDRSRRSSMRALAISVVCVVLTAAANIILTVCFRK